MDKNKIKESVLQNLVDLMTEKEGDLVTIRSYNGGTGPAFTSAADENYFSIIKD